MPALTGGRILLFLADASSFREEEARDSFYSWLSRDEAKRGGQFRTSSLRHAYLVSRGILRSVLGYYTATKPGKVSLRTSPLGKPFLDHPRNIAFNLSHSGPHIVLALGDVEELGVDIEQYKRSGFKLLSLADQCLSGEEHSQLLSLLDNRRDDRGCRHFFKLWTLKEAYLKARGAGLSQSLKSVSFLFRPDGSISFHETARQGPHQHGDQWNFLLCSGFDAFPLALAWRPRRGTVAPGTIRLSEPERSDERGGLVWRPRRQPLKMSFGGSQLSMF